MIEVSLINETDFAVPSHQVREVVISIVLDAGFEHGEVSIAIVDDDSIHVLNRKHLQHDYPTDVLSFVFDSEDTLEGEIIVSADTAIRNSQDYKWPAINELLLYVVHGTLHLVGYDDHSPEDCRAMREQEVQYMKRIGIELPRKHLQENKEETSA